MKWTLVTGGAKGLGATVCVELAKKKHPVLIHYNTSHVLANQILQKCLTYTNQVQTIQGDFSSESTLSDFIKQLKARFSIQNLINNVGNYLIKPSLSTKFSEWTDIFQLNLHAPFLLSQMLTQSIIDAKGSIINIGVAGLGDCRANLHSSAYMIAKNGLLGLTKTLAKELATQGVTVNMVSPGQLENSVDLPENLASLPMGRPTTTGEVAELILFLLSDKARHVTGQNIEISGGLRL